MLCLQRALGPADLKGLREVLWAGKAIQWGAQKLAVGRDHEKRTTLGSRVFY